MKSPQYTLILASQSPRRHELLGHLKIPFKVIASSCEEKSDERDPALLAKSLAMQKAHAVAQLCQKEKNPFIVAADTIVVKGEEVFGKPKDQSDSRRMLVALGGCRHQVITGVAFYYREKNGKWGEHLFSQQTIVEFAQVTEDLLRLYLDSLESLDKAGAYGIQGQALLFIKAIEGSYSNVVGFPLDQFVAEIKIVLGYAHDQTGQWRNCFRQCRTD